MINLTVKKVKGIRPEVRLAEKGKKFFPRFFLPNVEGTKESSD